MFKIVFLRALKEAFHAGDITREQLRKARWAMLNPSESAKLEQFAKQEIIEDEQGRLLLKELGLTIASDDDIAVQKLLNINWDWEKLLGILLRLAPIIIAFL